MAIEVIWGDEQQTLIHTIFVNEWDWYEFYAASGEICQMMQGRDHPVNVILDMQHGKRLPHDLMVHLQRVQFFQMVTGLVVVVQEGLARQSIPERMASLAHPDGGQSRMIYANDLFEAQVILSTKEPV